MKALPARSRQLDAKPLDGHHQSLLYITSSSAIIPDVHLLKDLFTVTSHLEYRYDVYVSCTPDDQPWMRLNLLPALQAAELRITMSPDHTDLASYHLASIEQEITQARYTLALLSPASLESQIAQFERDIAQVVGYHDKTFRLIPVWLPSLNIAQLPSRLVMLVPADCRSPESTKRAIVEIIQTIQGMQLHQREEDRPIRRAYDHDSEPATRSNAPQADQRLSIGVSPTIQRADNQPRSIRERLINWIYHFFQK